MSKFQIAIQSTYIAIYMFYQLCFTNDYIVTRRQMVMLKKKKCRYLYVYIYAETIIRLAKTTEVSKRYFCHDLWTSLNHMAKSAASAWSSSRLHLSRTRYSAYIYAHACIYTSVIYSFDALIDPSWKQWQWNICFPIILLSLKNSSFVQKRTRPRHPHIHRGCIVHIFHAFSYISIIYV